MITTPNVEYNPIIRHLAPQGMVDVGKKLIGSDGYPMRDSDHKFEWNRAEFEAWARSHADSHGYQVSFTTVGHAISESKWQEKQNLSSEASDVVNVGGATQVCLNFLHLGFWAERWTVITQLLAYRSAASHSTYIWLGRSQNGWL